MGYNSSLLFQLSSLLILQKGNNILANIEDLRITMYRSLAWPYLQGKLNTNQEKIDLDLKNKVRKEVLKHLHIWLLKSFTNFTGIAHQLYSQNLLSSLKSRVCNLVEERDTLHILEYEYYNMQIF